MTRPKAILDTNILVDFLSARAKYRELVLERPMERHLSAIVMMELRAGVSERKDLRELLQLVRGFESKNRILVPDRNRYLQAGFVLSTLRKQGWDVSRASFLGDILIALSAKQIGATVFTKDKDFESIRRVERFHLELVDSRPS